MVGSEPDRSIGRDGDRKHRIVGEAMRRGVSGPVRTIVPDDSLVSGAGPDRAIESDRNRVDSFLHDLSQTHVAQSEVLPGLTIEGGDAVSMEKRNDCSEVDGMYSMYRARVPRL